MSGLTYDMLKLWSPALVELAHRHLVHLQVSGAVPDCWKILLARTNLKDRGCLHNGRQPQTNYTTRNHAESLD